MYFDSEGETEICDHDWNIFYSLMPIQIYEPVVRPSTDLNQVTESQQQLVDCGYSEPLTMDISE